MNLKDSQKLSFNPKFTITNRMTSAITQIERARGSEGSKGAMNPSPYNSV
jgi:hypothetical protein